MDRGERESDTLIVSDHVGPLSRIASSPLHNTRIQHFPIPPNQSLGCRRKEITSIESDQPCCSDCVFCHRLVHSANHSRRADPTTKEQTELEVKRCERGTEFGYQRRRWTVRQHHNVRSHTRTDPRRRQPGSSR
ncbi:hypothetical protein BLNAU_4047 [Blattamonas nauphoetae]|uniref:Uncharacterized protein n=1 Tax=Blattamonas nauphoetae TaxID=2049346 RepID=A0ABQ9YB59_9EUKA|nr:hypothetical protein BLNAU_4047 [Blattamonas nauphoetae]